MRFRISGPGGQAVISLSDDATVKDLKTAVTKETSLATFDVKAGYPPVRLNLDGDDDQRLSDLKVNLNGERLLVTPKDAFQSTHGSQQLREASSISSHPANMASSSNTGSGASTFSFGGLPSSEKAPSKKPTGEMQLQRKSNPRMNDPPEIALPEHGGSLVLRIMPDDNSCLFRAISTAVMPGLDTMNELRSVVAQTIQANPEIYSKAVLDEKEPDVYCRWIQTEHAWGGQIELNIISNHFDIEICSIDVQRLRIDRYNEGKPKRCIVVYSGIHYDTIALSPFDAPPDFDRLVFDSSDEVLLSSAVELCEALKKKGYYTDTAAFKITCKQCGTVCVGEAGATEHASKTGHYSFDEGS